MSKTREKKNNYKISYEKLFNYVQIIWKHIHLLTPMLLSLVKLQHVRAFTIPQEMISCNRSKGVLLECH